MKKIFLSIVFCGCLLLGITGCGSNDEDKIETAAVTTTSGETKPLTSAQICDKYEENSKNFNKNYIGAKITFIGTVKSVDVGGTGAIGSANYDIIYFEEGFKLYLKLNQYKIVSSLVKGDKLYVETNIWTAEHCNVYGVQLMGNGGPSSSDSVSGAWTETELMKTIIDKVE